jgi:hypothetical protein
VDRPSDNVSMGMIVGLLLVVVVLLVVLTLAIMWVKKNYSGGAESAENEKTDDRQLLADLGKLKSELSPDVFKAFQRTIVMRDQGMMAMIGSALNVALERGGSHPGFGNMLLTLGISSAGGYGEAFLIGALEIYEKKFGPTHAETAMTLAVVARTLAKQKSPRAAEFLQRAVQLYETTLPDHAELSKLRAAYAEFAQRN